MYSLVISDILTAFADVERCFVLGDVTFGACCVDDLAAQALGADVLIHYGHSCLVPVDNTVVPCLYVFVDIKIDVDRLISTVNLNLKQRLVFEEKEEEPIKKDLLFIEQDFVSHEEKPAQTLFSHEYKSTKDLVFDGEKPTKDFVCDEEKPRKDSLVPDEKKPTKDNLVNDEKKPARTLVLAGTIQFGTAIRAAKPELEKSGFRVLVPQSKPLSAGEVLGCTAPSIPMGSFDDPDEVVLVFVADGRFHLEALMIANPKIKAFRYDPYIGSLFLEEYDHKGMKETRRNAILKAREAKNWGIVLGTLGRQGNPRILDRLEKKMRAKGLDWTIVLMSEISPARVSLFGDSVDAWIQIACPRLSIDWGDAFVKPLLTPFEAEIALGDIPGWWEREIRSSVKMDLKCNEGLGCSSNESCCAKVEEETVVDYPMDYYAQDGGEWNSCYSKKQTRPVRRNPASCNDNGVTS